jgi:DNA (cytosine-5)-methyltransferase 1
MTKNIVVRDISDAVAHDISQVLPKGMSRESYLRRLIAEGVAADVERAKTAKSKSHRRSDFDFIDLFAGVGGFHIGMVANGGRCVYANEWDKFAAQTYGAWTGFENVSTADIRTVDFSKEIPNHQVLCAGFPCQPFSIAGVSKKNSMGRAHGFEDLKQGNLFFAIRDIAAAKRPPILFLENVKNLKSHDKGNTWRVICEELEAINYEVKSQIIDANGYVPQHRERIFMVCFDKTKFTKEEIASFEFPRPATKNLTLDSILVNDAPDRKYMLTDGLWEYLQGYAAKHKAAGNGFGFSLVGRDDTSRTLSARYYKDGSEVLIKQKGWKNPRKLTPSEAMRLMGYDLRLSKKMGFKDGFPQVVSDTQTYKQCGNSVCPLVTEKIGKEIARVLKTRKLRLAKRQG